MDMNDYTAGLLAKIRVAELRALALREHVAAAARPAPRPLRVAVGLALIRLERAMVGEAGRNRQRVESATTGS